MTTPSYPAERAANVVLVMAIAAAATCIGAGIFQLRSGDSTGWLLVVLGIVPLLAAVAVRILVRKPPSDN